MGEWRRVRIGDVARQRKGSITISDDIEYKLCRVQLHRKGVLLREKLPGTAIKTKKQQVCKTGDLIVAEMDAKFGGYGFIGEELDGAIVSSHYYLYELDPTKISKEYFLVLIHSGTIQSQIEAKGSTNYSSIRGWEFLDYEILLPSLKLQHQIASRFNTCFSSVNQHDSQAAEQLSLLKQLRQAVLQEAVEGKLTADWRKQHPLVKGDPQHDAAALLAQIKADKERLVKAGKIRKEKPLPPIAAADKPFDLPDGWVWCRFGDILESTFYGPRFGKDEYKSEGIPTIRTTDMSNGKIVLKNPPQVYLDDEKAIEAYKLKRHDILITRTGSIGEYAVFDDEYLALPSAYLIRCRLIETRCIRYLLTLIASPQTQDHFGLNTQKGTKPNINASVIESILVPLPPLAEQQAIVARVDNLMAVIEELEQQVAQRKEQAQLLMQTVLREAFAG